MTVRYEDERKFWARLQSDPIYHIEKVQGVQTLEPYQRRACETILKNQFTAIRASHDLGKTWLLAKLVLWFGSSFPYCKIITTAPTWLQVEMLLWSEIRHGFNASKTHLGGRMLDTEWKVDNNWFAIGMSPRDDADSSGGGQGVTSGFQGFHAKHILIIFDEATGVPTKRWLQAHGMTTSANVRWVAIGNPTTKNCEFAKCFTSPTWAKVHLSCFDSPNLIANGITDMDKLKFEVDILRELGEEQARERMSNYKVVQESLLTLHWVVDRAMAWGFDHPLFQGKVLGNFPDEDENALFTLGDIEGAQRRTHAERPTDRWSLGVDVARFGTDRTVLTPLRGLNVLPSTMLVKRDTTQVSGECVKLCREAIKSGVSPERCAIIIDGTGVGAGVVDAVKEAQRHGQFSEKVEIREVHFGQGFDKLSESKDRDYAKEHYVNLKAKMFVDLSSAIKTELSLPNLTAYSEELPTIPYFLDSKGKYFIESKDDYKKRTGLPSPDYSDALALANFGRTQVQSPVGVMRVLR